MTTHTTGWHRHAKMYPREVWRDAGCLDPSTAIPVLVVDPTAARDVIARAVEVVIGLGVDPVEGCALCGRGDLIPCPRHLAATITDRVLAALEATP